MRANQDGALVFAVAAGVADGLEAPAEREPCSHGGQDGEPGEAAGELAVVASATRITAPNATGLLPS
jgi:hypothetical protein